MIPTAPVELFIFIVRMVYIIYKKMLSRFCGGISCSALLWLTLSSLLGNHFPSRIIPRIIVHGGIVINMLYITSSFQDKSFQSFLCKFFGCPSPAYTSSDNNSVEFCRCIFKTHTCTKFYSYSSQDRHIYSENSTIGLFFFKD